MSVSSDLYVGYTVTLKTNLGCDDFDFFDKFIEKYGEYDQYRDKSKGNVLLILDGMSGTYARLVFIDAYISDVWSETDDYVILRDLSVTEEVYNKLNRPYKIMYGEDLDKNLIQYALWCHCH